MKKKVIPKTKDGVIQTIINRHADENRYYEIIFIVHPECEVNQSTQSVIQKYAELFKNIEYKEQMGLRNLAFKVKKQITGFYFYMHVVCKLADIDAFKKLIKRDQDILRYMIIRHKWNYEKLKALMTPKVQPNVKAKDGKSVLLADTANKTTTTNKTIDEDQVKISNQPSESSKKVATAKTMVITDDSNDKKVALAEKTTTVNEDSASKSSEQPAAEATSDKTKK